MPCKNALSTSLLTRIMNKIRHSDDLATAVMKLCSFFLFLSVASPGQAQSPLREAGLRGGISSGFNLRVRLDETLSYEAQLSYRNSGGVFSLYRQSHRSIGMDRTGNWDFIYGFGAHVGFYFTDSYRTLLREVYFGRKVFTPVAGFGGYLGIDYQLIDVPVSVGISFQPHMEISLARIFGLNFWDLGLCIRYRF